MTISPAREKDAVLAMSGYFVEWLKDETSHAQPANSVKIKEKFGIDDTQTRYLVNHLRCRGDEATSRIGSDSRGYYWLDTFADAGETITHLRQRAESIYAAYRGIMRAFKRSEDQGELAL